MCEYEPVVRYCQGQSDFSLLQWVQPTQVYNDWTIIKYPPRDLRSSTRIEEKGRGRKTRLADVGFHTEDFGGFVKNLP